MTSQVTRPLYEAIVLKAREMHLAGATVLRGAAGFGRSTLLHTAKNLYLSQDLPIVIEIVDAEDRIDAFLPELEKLMRKSSTLVTLEKAKVLRYGNDADGPSGLLEPSDAASSAAAVVR